MNWVAPTAPMVSGGMKLKPPFRARVSYWETPSKLRETFAAPPGLYIGPDALPPGDEDRPLENGSSLGPSSVAPPS